MKLPKNWLKLFQIALCLAISFTLFQFEAFGITPKNRTSTKNRQAGLWKIIEKEDLPASGRRSVVPEKHLVFRLDQEVLTDLLARMPLEFTVASRMQTVVIEVPMPDGKLSRFRIEESPILAPNVAAEMPGVKTFSGQGIDDPTAIARFDWIPARGFHGYILAQSGTVYIDPYQENDRENYLVYYKHEYGKNSDRFSCRLDEKADLSKAYSKSTIPAADFSNGANLRTYRIAIATTGEYTQSFASQAAAFNDVIAAVNRINTIYRRDLAVNLTLVSNQNSVFPNPATDPYDNSDSAAQLDLNQTQLDTIYGNGNYDIGHLFGTGGGGVALSPSVCAPTDKAKGYSARVPPTGDPFWVDYVAHEMGHQFSASHTYNTLEGGTCSTRSATDAFEVGSGATIMSYVGICGDRNLQQFAIDGFHIRSLTQIITDLNDNTSSGSCGTPTATGNNVPTVNPGGNFTIPKLTPFTLTATGTDADAGDALTYSWEEYDLAPSASGPDGAPAGTYDVDTDGVLRPLFRMFAPVTTPSRTYPSLTYILNNSNTPPLTFTGTSPTGAVCEPTVTCVTGENLPSVARTMNFRVVVRDNRAAGGGVTDAGMTVTVDGATGPFRVTAQNTFMPVTWQGNSTQTVTWDVNGSNANAANVKISLSTDGGLTFPTTILASTPNDGTEQITVPNMATTQARVKIEGVGNIFFDINDVNFTIMAATSASATVSGRVLSSDGSRGISRAAVSIAGQSGPARTVLTNAFGYYSFENVGTGQTYMVDARHKWFQFTPQAVTINGDIADLNLMAQP